jgi:hypothetical protein
MTTFNFAANQSVDALEVVPETLRGFYEEDKANGKFTISAAVKPLVDEIIGANNKITALSKQKGDDNRKDAARRTIIDNITSKLTEAGIEVGEDLNALPDLLGTKLTELMTAVKDGKSVNVNLEAIKKDFDKRLGAEKATYQTELQNMQNTLHEYMVKNAALASLSEAGTVAGGQDLLLPQISAQAKVIKTEDGKYVVRVVDEENNVRLNNKGEPMGVNDLVLEMKQKFPMTFKSEQKPGTGSTPGTAKGQQQVMRKDPKEEKSSIQKISAALSARQR